LHQAVTRNQFAALDRLREARMALLLVDQMAGLALALADRACLLEGGRIDADGPAAGLANGGAPRASLPWGERGRPLWQRPPSIRGERASSRYAFAVPDY